MDQANINFAVYEDGSEFLGITSVTLPDINWLTSTVSGAGLAGNIEAVIIGHLDAMTMTMNFRTVTQEAIRLTEPRRHNIDLRVAQQDEDTVAGAIQVRKVKHVMVVVPKAYKGGNVAPASAADASGDYAVRYWATFIDGKKVTEIDPMNYICVINGVDYLADVRTALGK